MTGVQTCALPILLKRNLDKPRVIDYPKKGDMVINNDYSSNNSNNSSKEKNHFDRLGKSNINIISQLKQSKYSFNNPKVSKKSSSTTLMRSSSVINMKSNYNSNNINNDYQYYINKLKSTKLKMSNNKNKQETKRLNRVNSASKLLSKSSSEFKFTKSHINSYNKNNLSNYNSNIEFNYIK